MPSLSSTATATWALFLGLALVMLGNGLNGVVLGVRASQEGYGLFVSGLVMASYFAGFLLGARYAQHVLATVGHVRVFAALASTASTVVLIQALFVGPVLWAIMRFVFGGCMAGLYVAVESWLNNLATNATRARLLSVYMVVSMGGLAGGQLLLNVASPDGFELFVVASALVSLALVPVTLSAASAPPASTTESIGVLALARAAPGGVVASFCTGAGAGALMGLGPIYGSSVGLSSGRIAAVIAAAMVGGVIFQWPVGWVADRVARRPVVICVAVLAVAASVGLLLVDDGSHGALALMFLLGGGMYPLYSLGIVYTNDGLHPAAMLGAGATLVRVNGLGALSGAVVGAIAMGAVGPRSFFVVIGSAYAVVAIFFGVRLVGGVEPPQDTTPYLPFPVRSGPLLISHMHGAGRPDGSPKPDGTPPTSS